MATRSSHVAPAPKLWQRRSSRLARLGLLVYAVFLIDASLHPWSGWRDRGIAPFEYLYSKWPTYYTAFDITVNVVGYLPLGILTVLAVYPLVRGWPAALLSMVFALALSCSLEAVQTFLPSRVPSRLDLLTNFTGAAVGALLAARWAGAILDRGRLLELRMRWFERDASVGLVVLFLWFFSLLYPDVFAFAPGGLLKPVFDALGVDPEWQIGGGFDAAHFMAWQAGLAILSIGGAGALLLALMRPFAPCLRAVVVFVVLSGVAQTLSAGLSAGQTSPFAWVTPGTQIGLAGALCFLGALALLPPVWRARVGLLALAGAVAVAGVLPHNPYFGSVTRHWAYGQYLNFYGLTLALHLSWPILAFAALVRPAWSGNKRGRTL